MARYVYVRPEEVRISRGGPRRSLLRPGVPQRQAAVTPIPLRSSRYPQDVTKVSARYSGLQRSTEDIAWRPTVPQLPATPAPIDHSKATWAYDSPRYAASSSLANLSLALTDGAQAIAQRKGMPARSLPVPIEARPLVRVRPPDIAEIPTFPPLLSRSQVATRPQLLKLLDAARWWLLVPGRLELLLWLCGTVLLMVCTALLVWFFCIGWHYFFA